MALLCATPIFEAPVALDEADAWVAVVLDEADAWFAVVLAAGFDLLGLRLSFGTVLSRRGRLFAESGDAFASLSGAGRSWRIAGMDGAPCAFRGCAGLGLFAAVVDVVESESGLLARESPRLLLEAFLLRGGVLMFDLSCRAMK